MLSNTLTCKTSLLYRFASKPTPLSNPKLQIPLNPIKVTGLRATCSISSSFSNSLNYAHGSVTGSIMGFKQRGFGVSAGGVGRGNSGGRGVEDSDDYDDGDCGEMLWCLAFRCVDTIDAIISFIRRLIRFHWIPAGGQVLKKDPPPPPPNPRPPPPPPPNIHLISDLRLTEVLLAFAVNLIIYWIPIACVIFLVIFCCIRVLAMAVRKDASEDDIKSLPKCRYCRCGALRRLRNNSNSANALVLLPEDSECCICLCRYVDGAELHSLPCNHHFHCGCITKWLRRNATCPLCRFNCSGLS